MSHVVRCRAADHVDGLRVPLRVTPVDRAFEPGWLTAARRRAAAWAEANGLPSTRQEEWRSTKLDPALALGLEAPSEAAAVDPVLVELPAPHLGGARIVVVNGHFAPELSRLGGLPEGARIEPLADALQAPARHLAPLWPRHAASYPHALRALNDAAVLDGVLVELAAGTVVPEPIEVVLISVPTSTSRWSHPRLVVLADAQAGATLVETYVGPTGASTVTNALTQVVLGKEASLDHYVLQDESLESVHLSALEARLGRKSRLASRLVATGGRLARHEARAVLGDDDAEVVLDGLFLTAAGQHHDNVVRVDHRAIGGRSRQLYKGAVAGDGHGVFNGNIVVHHGAVGTDAAQVSRSLLLSEHAKVDTRPRLEIFADDVACSHGAAVGQLDPDALFYLRSRGVPEHEARSVLVAGFAQEILCRFPPGPIRQRAERLASGTGLVTLDEERDGASRAARASLAGAPGPTSDRGGGPPA